MSNLAGYVTDIPYVRGFKPMLAPAWLDLVAVINGYRPPRRNDGFSWCDLGCGQGATAAILAGTHTGGAFHGIDGMPAHIAHAAGLAAEAGINNVRFHAMDFAAAGQAHWPRFDYIVAHGVYSWVDATARAQLRAFISAHLKSGGLAYISYNALPGWTSDLPFQYLARELAASGPGNSAVRFDRSAALIRRLAEAGAERLSGSYIVNELRDRPHDYSLGYLVHEFLHAGWRPLYVTELRHDMAEVGLKPVGSATLVENFDGWTLSRRGHMLLTEVADADQRELLRDFLIDQRFRCDVFTCNADRLNRLEQRQALLNGGLALARPPAAISYRLRTPAGNVEFDNPISRAIVARLAAGARCLADLADADATSADLIANMLALCAADDVRPAEVGRAHVERLNRVLRRRLGGPEEIPVLALPCGTALDINHGMRGLSRGADGAIAATAWRDFLALYGIS